MHNLTTLYNKIRRTLFPPKKSEFEKTVEQWYAANGDKTLRLTYPLTPESIVFDVGGFEGQWASDIFAKYQPTIHIFEPVKKFATDIRERFARNDNIHVHTIGLSDTTEKASIALTDDRSSVFVHDAAREVVDMVRASDFLRENNIAHIDLLKLNIEGGEYPLLEDLIKHDFIQNIDNIQVQFHSFAPNAVERMNAIRQTLEKTHSLTYSFPFVWENWKRNV